MKMKKYLSVLLAVLLLTGLGLFGAVHAEAANAVNYTPPANLDKLSQAEQLAYFNLVVNRVRTEQPGFQQKTLLAIDSIKLSGAAGAANGIIESMKKEMMPGEWVSQDVAAGTSNQGLFFSENANASDLNLADITGISCKKEGGYWVITLGIAQETNPVPGLASAHGRIIPVATREAVVEEITAVSDKISIDPKNASLHYYGGFVCVIVNGEGKVTAGANSHRAQAQLNNVKVSVIRTDVSAEQSSEQQYTKFSWATEPSPALPAPPEPPAPKPSPEPSPKPISCLARIWNFILKWVLFGWLWMK